MKKTLLLLILTLLIVSCASNREYKDLTLTNEGKTRYHIIIPENPTDKEAYAAQILQEYLYKISGAKVPIVNECEKQHKEEICIGKTKRHPNVCKQKNTISVVKSGKCLVFNCEDDAYTMYSVIDFMEKYLGVRQFTSYQDYYPIDSTIVLKDFQSYTYTTPSSFRSINSRFNSQDIHLKYWLKDNTTDEMFANGYFVHTSQVLLSDKEYFDTHPEYFALINGKRSRESVCWSNTEFYNIMRDNLKQAMALQPDKNVWSVSQNDNDIYCQCDKCMEIINKYGSPAAPIILFVNKLAKEFPNKTISTLAYRYSRKCPEGLAIEPNVQIMLCSIEVDRNKTIEEQGTHENTFAYDLNQWGKITKNIFLWDYTIDFAYSISPFPNLHVLQPNIQLFVKNNVSQFFEQGNNYEGYEFSELKNYLISKLLWDPYINQDSIVNEFCNAYYGDACKYMIKYIDELEKQAIKYKGSVVLDIYGSPVAYKNNILSKENIELLDNYLQIAEQIANGDSVYLQRVRTARMPLDYAIMEIGKTDMYGQRGWFEQVADKWILKTDMLKRLERFHQTALNGNITSMNESGLEPNQYYQATKRFIDNDITDDLAFRKEIKANIQPAAQYCSGDLSTLTDGVKGADDYKMLWIGWWGKDVELTMDLKQITKDKTITISSLANNKSWILHPMSVECLVSKDGKKYTSIGKQDGDGLNKNNPIIKDYKFKADKSFRYVKFKITATKTLPIWHPCYTQDSWLFLDEIIVK